MGQANFAGLLITADPKKQIDLLKEHPVWANVSLAQELQTKCAAAWTSDPERVQNIAQTLDALANYQNDPEIRPYAEWAQGISSLIGGQVTVALDHLQRSERQFVELEQPHRAATTQIGKLYVLALLGRYDEAIACGQKALEIFLAENDQLSAGKVEHNIGGVYSRRDMYPEATRHLESARRRFLQIDHLPQLAKVENSLAIVLAAQNDFRGAERLFQQALARAQIANLLVTQAEIEGSIGNLNLFTGRYDLALEALERSLRGYEALAMPHQIATTELEIAGIYLELNLLPEALALYEKTERSFSVLGMQAELARCLLDQAKANLWLGHQRKARELLDRAGGIFAVEGNSIAVATVKLTKARLLLLERELPAATQLALEAQKEFTAGGSERLALVADLLQGELALEMGALAAAQRSFEAVSKGARAGSQPQILYACLSFQGELARGRKQSHFAEGYFREAVELVENTRGLLPSEDHRTAYFGNKLGPYHGLVQLSLDKGDDLTAFNYLELARTRSLNDAMRGDLAAEPADHANETGMRQRLNEIRSELNWFYSRMNRPGSLSPVERSEISALRDAARVRENELLELTRRSRSKIEIKSVGAVGFDLAALQSRLGRDRVLIEYAVIENVLLAFVVTDRKLEVVGLRTCPKAIVQEVTQFAFQCKTMRLGPELIGRRKVQLLDRVLGHAGRLFDQLLRPLEHLIGTRHLVISPYGVLNYLPFQALHDGTDFVVVKREVSYTASAGVLLHCLEQPPTRSRSATLVGVADEQTPFVRGEIDAIKGFFGSATCLLDDAATTASIRDSVTRTDLLHLACHGNFRPDNPLFSALHLTEGSLTVRDVCAFDLRSKLVTLSACETGLNAILPGEELIGLARGFLSAGAASLLTSLWAVSDRSTARLMKEFYAQFCQGVPAAAALRLAQVAILADEPHPYHWAPFILLGRW